MILPPSTQFTTIWNNFHQGLLPEAESLLHGPDQVLTGKQAFAVALLAGARIETKLVDNQLTITTEPVGVVRTNNRLTVYKKA